jgi:hypothetical protein
MGLDGSDDGGPTLQEIVDGAAAERTHRVGIDQAPGDLFTDVIDLDAGGATLVPGSDWIVFWQVTSQGGGATTAMSGDGAAIARWNLNGLGGDPSGPELVRFGIASNASP